jgi:hypothetical protein
MNLKEVSHTCPYVIWHRNKYLVIFTETREDLKTEKLEVSDLKTHHKSYKATIILGRVSTTEVFVKLRHLCLEDDLK